MRRMLNSLGSLGLITLAGALAGCGALADSSLLASRDPAAAAKIACPGDHQGFFVCLSADSALADQSVGQTIATGLAKLADLVNSQTFQSQVGSAFTSGDSIDQSLTSANYIVTIKGYCDAHSNVLATGVVGGASINYNECRVQRDANGQPDLAHVSGVLLHEISHNLGYTHPAVNPSRSTVPYYLGDLADSDLATAAPTATSRQQYDFGD